MEKNDSLNDKLLNILRSQYPQKPQLVNKLVDILNLGKEAIYRRLRGNVSFTAHEVMLITEKLNIPFNDVISTSDRSRPFSLKVINFISPEKIDYKMKEDYNQILSEIQDEPDTEYGSAVKMFPDSFHLRFNNISRFYLFKWIYQYSNPGGIKRFDEISSPEKMKNELIEMMNLHQGIKVAYYILDRMLFQNFIYDILYFASVDLISPHEVKLLKEELFLMIDYIERLAIEGKNELGNEVKLYISNINFETGFSYLQTSKYKLSLLRCFTFYDVTSMDDQALKEAKVWIGSLKRSAFFISGCGELQRVDFFSEQRRIVDSL